MFFMWHQIIQGATLETSEGEWLHYKFWLEHEQDQNAEKRKDF